VGEKVIVRWGEYNISFVCLHFSFSFDLNNFPLSSLQSSSLLLLLTFEFEKKNRKTESWLRILKHFCWPQNAFCHLINRSEKMTFFQCSLFLFLFLWKVFFSDAVQTGTISCLSYKTFFSPLLICRQNMTRCQSLSNILTSSNISK